LNNGIDKLLVFHNHHPEGKKSSAAEHSQSNHKVSSGSTGAAESDFRSNS
jgi:hypothetical protein